VSSFYATNRGIGEDHHRVYSLLLQRDIYCLLLVVMLNEPIKTTLNFDIIHCIAMHLSDFGSRSALNAALIHPSLTATILESRRNRGIIALINEEEELASLLALPMDEEG
jgi:hypothetical protein